MHEEHTVSPKKHKRSGRSYHPTAPSTKKLIKELAAGSQGPNSLYSEATAAADGMHGCELTSDLPRAIEQVKNARKSIKN